MSDSETDSSPSSPRQLGPYLLEHELGSGGMGTVYFARHAETGEEVAVKVLPANLARQPGFVARFDREIAAIRNVKSPHCVQLYDSGEDDGTYFFAMEFVPGETITARLLREKRIPWREVIEIGVQVCRALKAAHNAGVIHRDLKPSNLILRPDGVVKLTDFGIAQVFAASKLTATGGILGTAEYMSPEQAQGRRVTKQSDIYSLGAVLYTMLSGRPPFTGKTTLDIVQKHKFAQFDSPRRIVPEIPHWLDEVVCQCLSKKPEDRYPDAYVLELRLQEIPRKVDYKQAQEDLPLDGASPTAVTMAAADDVEAQGGGGGATIMRDLMRAELETQERKGPIGRLFDNPLILLLLLVTIVVGTFVVMSLNQTTPGELFRKGEELMERPEGPAWLAAKRDYFQPLLDMDEETWGPRVEPYLQRIAFYELKNELLRHRSSPLQNIPSNEIERQLRLALDAVRVGHFQEANQRLEALKTLLAGDSERRALALMVDEISTVVSQHDQTNRFRYLEEALQRAEDARQNDRLAQARAIWRSVIELYDANDDAAEFVATARRALTETDAAIDSAR